VQKPGKPPKATPKPLQCDIKATPKRVDSQAIGTPMRPQCDPKATPRRRQNAECRMQKGEAKPPRARYVRGTSQVRAKCKPSASQVHGRYMRGTCVVHAWYMRGTSHPEPIPKLRELEVSRRAAVLLPWGFRSHYNGSCLFRQGCVRPCATFSRRRHGREGRRPYQARSRPGAAHLNR